jgi:hypothetical protein
MASLVKVKDDCGYEVLAGDGSSIGFLYKEYVKAYGNPRYVGHFPGGFEWTLDYSDEYMDGISWDFRKRHFDRFADAKKYVVQVL